MAAKRLRRSSHLSTFAHMGAVYLVHDLYGYLLQMSPDVLAVLDAFEGGADSAEVARRFTFDGATAEQFIDVFAQHACLVEPDDDERELLWPFVAWKGKWNVWRREGARVTVWTAWGDAPVKKLELDDEETRIWDAIDGETRMSQLAERFGRGRVLDLVTRLAHSDVQAVKLCMFPRSQFAKRPGLTPNYLTSTMPYARWSPADGPPRAFGREVSPAQYYAEDIGDADAQFDHQETTLSHLFRKPHPAIGGRTYGEALVDALAARGVLLQGRARILEIGGGLGFVAEAMIGALAKRGVTAEYTIVELAPPLAAAQRRRLGTQARWIEGDALTADVPGEYDLVIANEMIGDLPAVQLSRADVGMNVDMTGEVSPEALKSLGRPGELVTQLGLRLDDAPEPFYLLTGAFELILRIARWLAPGGTAVVTEFGELAVWPRLSTQLDHPELSIHFGQLQQAAHAAGLEAKVDFVIDLIALDREAKGLATTRSHFRALRAMLADAGVTLEKIGYTPQLFEGAIAGQVHLGDIGELRWEKIEDRLMGLVPHEFKALLATRPAR
jgi:SAM-dependent methyltransferase